MSAARPSLRQSPTPASLPENVLSVVPATRLRSEIEQGTSGASADPFVTDINLSRARKRQRTEPCSVSFPLPKIDRPPHLPMRITDSDQESTLTVSSDYMMQAGPSNASLDQANGHTNTKAHVSPTNGYASHTVNGSCGFGTFLGNGTGKHGKAVSRVNLPGTTLYDDSSVDREEFVRLVIQSLRDVGYIESAATLEAESGYTMESSEVSEFRQYVLEGAWDKAGTALERLGVNEEEGLWEAKFMLSQQKYLELLEENKTTQALHVLRNELAPLNADSEQLHILSGLIMCSESDELRKRSGWDGASGTSRRRLLINLQRYVPSSVMIPPRRIATLLHQARSYQRHRCLYHISPSTAGFSLYSDHQCDRNAFPRITTFILEGHSDQVWNIEWSHNGQYLATASKDKTAIIWQLKNEPDEKQWESRFTLGDHPYSVGCLAWSNDDSILLTTAENHIRLWNTKTGICIRALDEHNDTVTALSWLPDDSGFISGALDRTIIQWDADGTLQNSWGPSPIRVTGLAVAPDLSRLVTIGMQSDIPSPSDISHPARDGQTPSSGGGNGILPNSLGSSDNRMIVYDLATKLIEANIRFEGQLTNVRVSHNSQYSLINQAPDEIHLWDLNAGRLARKFTGQRQANDVIRSCFGGIEGNFIVSGSEDANIYVWHRDTGVLLEILSGHGEGSVNSVAWNPHDERMFASCSDDRTVRIWEALPLSEFGTAIMCDSTHPALSRLETQNRSEKGKVRQQSDAEELDI